MSYSKPNQPFSPAPFKPPFWLTNPHLQSILPKFFAPKAPTYRRVVEKTRWMKAILLMIFMMRSLSTQQRMVSLSKPL